MTRSTLKRLAFAAAWVLLSASALAGQGPLAEPAGPGAGLKISRAIAAGLGFGVPFSESEGLGAGFGPTFFATGFLARDLLPGRGFPFPAILLADAEFAYFPASDGITDVVFALHAGLGLDLLRNTPGFTLFPYAGVGFGIESVSGRLSHGWWSEDVSETRAIFPFELGAGFAYRLTPRIGIFARGGFSFPFGAANVTGYFRLQGGILFEF
jgi:hypothetical protein